MNGIMNVLKPPGMTSHDVVYFVRRVLGTKKVGHTGTLDPEAAGVLPVCIGKGTKVVQYLTDKQKRYRATIKFGITTDTGDRYGSMLETRPAGRIDPDDLLEVLNCFKGRISQIPPIYSAIKLKGKKLYQYALEGEQVEIASREVEIFDISLVAMEGADEAVMDICCSKGTYIRSLCRDIGEQIGCGAHMAQLIRTASTPYTIDKAHTLEEIEKAVREGKVDSIVDPIDSVFISYPAIWVKPSARNAVMNGNLLYEQGIVGGAAGVAAGEDIRIYLEQSFIGLGTVLFDETEQRKVIKIKNLLI